MQKYKILKTIGDGTFGTVFKALSPNQQIVAIKKMKQKYKSWEECSALRQIKSLRKLEDPTIVKLRQVILSNSELYIVFDFIETNLYQVYTRAQQSNRTLTQSQIKSIFYQIAQGLSYLHRNGYFHRDLKPQNILCHNNQVKICDFGLARQIRSRPPFTDYVSTRWYRAPQLLLRSTSYNSPVDIFALACIIIELYTMKPLFPGNNQIETMNKIVQFLGTPKKADWPEGYKLASSLNYNFPDKKKQDLMQILPNASLQAIQLLQSMLQYSSRKRPAASQILKHPFFQNMNPNFVQQEKQKRQTKFSFYEKNIVQIPNNVKVQNPKDMEMRRSQIKFGGSFTSSFMKTKQQKYFENELLEPSQKKIQSKTNIVLQKKQSFPIKSNKDKMKFDQFDEILQQLEMKQNEKKQQKQITQLSGTKILKQEPIQKQFASSAKQELRMPLFSLGGFSSMTSTKIKTPVIKQTKLS